MSQSKEIWVLPEMNGKSEEASKLSYGLLSEARSIADSIGGSVSALVLSDREIDYAEVFSQYGVDSAYILKDPLLGNFSAEAYSAALVRTILEVKPWLFLLGDTIIGKELGPRLTILLDTGLISNCVKMDVRNAQKPRFYRLIYEGQVCQETVIQTNNTILVTMDPKVLNVSPCSCIRNVRTSVIEPKLSPEIARVKHLEFVQEDFRAVDVADADVIVSAGMGVVNDNLLSLVEELASLIGGSIGTTRPVADEGKISKERVIGQTGKIVSPKLYLALAISGATHHLGGIQDSGTIVSVNRDPQAPIFQNSDVGVVADLRDVLPMLIGKIKQAKENGKTL